MGSDGKQILMIIDVYSCSSDDNSAENEQLEHKSDEIMVNFKL